MKDDRSSSQHLIEYANVYWKANPAYFMKLKKLHETCKKGFIAKLKSKQTRKEYVDDYSCLLAWVFDVTKEQPLPSLSTRINWIFSGRTSFPTCEHCHRSDNYKLKALGISEQYRKTCSRSCSSQHMQQKVANTKKMRYGDSHYCNKAKAEHTCLRRFGATNIFGSRDGIAKARATKKARYGNEFYSNHAKAMQTIACKVAQNENYYDEIIARSIETKRRKNSADLSYFRAIMQKSTDTRLARYHSWNPPDMFEKVHHTKLARYGNPTWNNRKKAMHTTIARYGFHHVSQIPEVKKKIEDACIARYGAKSYTSSDRFKDLWKNEKWKDAIVDKVFNTKKKNGSFKKSIQEDEAFEMLRFIFPKLQRQHFSSEYPFHCDFYDPCQPNVRFEFQGSWTHGKHAFNEQVLADQLQLMKMLAKGTSYYLNAIQTWTVRDPHKREVAKKNSISLIEFWSLSEVRDFVIHFFDDEKNFIQN